MKIFLVSSVCLVMIMISCSKQEPEPVKKTYLGNLPIVYTNTPPVAIAGENIISNVQCELASVSGSVSFKGFSIVEISPRQFNITAKALYQNWYTQITMPVIFTLDTIASIETTGTGKYFLHFYNNQYLLKTDTVEVN